MVEVRAGRHIPVALLLAALPSRQQAGTPGRRHAGSGLAYCLLLTSWMPEVPHGSVPPAGQGSVEGSAQGSAAALAGLA